MQINAPTGDQLSPVAIIEAIAPAASMAAMMSATHILLRPLIAVPRYPASIAKTIPKMTAVTSKLSDAGACGSTCVSRNSRYDGTAKIS